MRLTCKVALLSGLLFCLPSCSVPEKIAGDNTPFDVAASKLKKRRQRSYREELEVVLDQSKEADFTNLRMRFTDTENYVPYETDTPERVFNALHDENFEKCIEITEQYLRRQFVSLAGHYAAMVCHTELGHEEKSLFHRFVLDGLINSINSSGDGKSAKTAFVTISTDELYSFIQLAGLEVKGQALIHQGGQSYDVMAVKNRATGGEFELYFNVSTQMTKGMPFQSGQ